MADNNVDLFQWPIIFVDKKISGSGIKMRIFQNDNNLKELAEQFTRKN